jgi:hypothetical protein
MVERAEGPAEEVAGRGGEWSPGNGLRRGLPSTNRRPVPAPGAGAPFGDRRLLQAGWSVRQPPAQRPRRAVSAYSGQSRRGR